MTSWEDFWLSGQWSAGTLDLGSGSGAAGASGSASLTTSVLPRTATGATPVAQAALGTSVALAGSGVASPASLAALPHDTKLAGSGVAVPTGTAHIRVKNIFYGIPGLPNAGRARDLRLRVVYRPADGYLGNKTSR